MCAPINGGSQYTFVSSTLTGSLTDIHVWVEIVTGHTFHKKIKK